MDLSTVAQLVLTPILAAITTLFVKSRQDRERVNCFVDWKYVQTEESFDDFPYLGIHNRSSQPIAVHRVQLLKNGFFLLVPEEGTALLYDDPTDLNFPYLVAPGEIKSLALDAEKLSKLAAATGPVRTRFCRIFGDARIVVECATTANTILRVSAEQGLPWNERLPWARR